MKNVISKMNLRKAILILSMFLGISMNASATQIQCTGKLNGVILTIDGYVMTLPSWADGQGIVVCSINTTWKNVTPAACAGILSMAQTAFKTKATTTTAYELTVKVSSCSTVPKGTGAAPAPSWYMFY